MNVWKCKRISFIVLFSISQWREWGIGPFQRGRVISTLKLGQHKNSSHWGSTRIEGYLLRKNLYRLFKWLWCMYCIFKEAVYAWKILVIFLPTVKWWDEMRNVFARIVSHHCLSLVFIDCQNIKKMKPLLSALQRRDKRRCKICNTWYKHSLYVDRHFDGDTPIFMTQFEFDMEIIEQSKDSIKAVYKGKLTL